jgi:hypothetical protein
LYPKLDLSTPKIASEGKRLDRAPRSEQPVRVWAIPDPFETMRLQTVPGGAESPESVRQRSNLAELLAYPQCQERSSELKSYRESG